MKHFPFDASQRENRDINHGDNHDAEKHWRADLFAGGDNRLHSFVAGEGAPKLVLSIAKPAHDVFHDDDRAINDESKINRAQAHQVAGDAESRHADEREKKRKRNCRGHDKRRAPVAKRCQQNNDNEHRALEQIVFYGADGAINQL